MVQGTIFLQRYQFHSDTQRRLKIRFQLLRSKQVKYALLEYCGVIKELGDMRHGTIKEFSTLNLKTNVNKCFFSKVALFTKL